MKGRCLKLDTPAPHPFIANELRFIVVWILSYKNQNPTGYIQTPFSDEKLVFESLTQLLLRTDKLIDELGCPQRSHNPRFLISKSVESQGKPPCAVPRQKSIASFRICVMFRMNASWQGSCEWLEESKSANFRSVLELVQMIDEVLTAKLAR